MKQRFSHPKTHYFAHYHIDFLINIERRECFVLTRFYQADKEPPTLMEFRHNLAYYHRLTTN